ncbi:MAG: hypothetical protein AB8C46_25175 [Burkholderiaceae bacterium]
MSSASAYIAAPTSASTHPRNTLRLLTLAAVVLVILFKHPGAEDSPTQPALAVADQVASVDAE